MERIIEVALSRNMTPFSWLTYFLDGGGLTHASIAADADSDHYYSFNFKGFKRERKSSLMKYSREIKRYRIAVTEEQYQKLKRIIRDMETKKSTYAYAGGDVGFALLKLPFLRPNNEKTYFCSQFVAQVLDESGCVPLTKEYRTYTPNDIAEALEESGKVVEVIHDTKPDYGIGGAFNSVIGALEKGKNSVVKFASKQTDPAKKESAAGPLRNRIGTDVIDACENVYQSAATVTNKMKSTIESLPKDAAKTTGKMVDSMSDTVSKLMKGK